MIAGFGNSICWTIIGVYVTLLSKHYSKIANVPFTRVQTLFFAVCASIFLTCNLFFIHFRLYTFVNYNFNIN